jgi:hypothetical protein
MMDDKETQSPVLKVFKEMIQREKKLVSLVLSPNGILDIPLRLPFVI